MTKFARLYPGERFATFRGIPHIQWDAIHDSTRPLAVFLTGGGHLGRIAYGHPEGKANDFLAHWLVEEGYNVLVPSPPIQHNLFEEPIPDLNILTWCEVLLDIIVEKIRDFDLSRRFVAIGWSMAGRFAIRLASVAKTRGIEIDGFVGLAATPPIPGLSPIDQILTPVNPQGFRQFVPDGDNVRQTVSQRWLASLEVQNQAAGRTIIDPAAYQHEFIGNSPLALHGEALRIRRAAVYSAIDEAYQDVMASAFSQAPLCASISPTSLTDFHHSFTDTANWAYLTTHSIASRLKPSSQEALGYMCGLIDEIPTRLSRRVPGGHFLFVGQPGAQAVAISFNKLHLEMLEIAAMVSEASQANFAITYP
ncbi:alpha/beta fold hydrolase [Rhizobium miluonense]|uniref:Alpha/beta hydrolase family n=1 Tax=Rhizobium miluonense TaxID=411945 RepID=A0A1C3X045_9HYPH|nr:alpha/beta fold hydrolase [Rhizobium miluonense]SCB45642.1 Alpha/beta hydrolase family [Rhizobium miluonense]